MVKYQKTTSHDLLQRHFQNIILAIFIESKIGQFHIDMQPNIPLVHPEIMKLRKELHTYPELSGQEYETAKRIWKFAEKHAHTARIETFGKTAIAIIYEFSKKGKTIAIRCELDALPIVEENEFPHKSANTGVSHKCGHDGHMAMVSGLVFWLETQPIQNGKVILLFQPAEETGKGAQMLVQDKKFEALGIDYVFALHNIPKEPINNIIITPKGFSAEVISVIIKTKGKEAHAAEPENGINPALAISKIIGEMALLNHTDPHLEDFAVLTPVHLLMGEKAYGISPSNAELHYTIRTWNSTQMSDLTSKIEALVEQICRLHKLDFNLEWLEYFPASINDTECSDQIHMAAFENGLEIVQKNHPFKFGEDFGWYSKKYKTAMFGLGAGVDSPALHHADYDFPDEIIGAGIQMFTSIIQNILK